MSAREPGRHTGDGFPTLRALSRPGAEQAPALAPGEAGAQGRSVLGSQGRPWDEAVSRGLRRSGDERGSPPLQASVSKTAAPL